MQPLFYHLEVSSDFSIFHTLRLLVRMGFCLYLCFSFLLKWWQQKKAKHSHCSCWQPAYCVLGESTLFLNILRGNSDCNFCIFRFIYVC